ncbi:MAG TPA: hypothetical protein VNN80_30985 [Polyangiaceae bacterium]|nr:hypothetical protein [Polyangiaceae bacterium]
MSAASALHGALVLLALSACQSVLGIQDLSEEPRPGAPGAGGTDGSGEPTAVDTPAPVGTGGTGETGASPAARDNPQPGPAGTSTPSPAPLSDAGAPDAVAPTPGITVAGRVIDFFRRPVPDTVVSIGASTAITDADGRFSIADVTPPYTASFVATVFLTGGQGRYGYVYEGLTREDPTLQTYSVLPARGASSLVTTYPNTTFDTGRFTMVAFGTPDGARFSDDEATNGTEYVGTPNWSGPASTTGFIHALLCTRADTFDPPSGYEAHQAVPLTVTDNAQGSAAFDNLPLGSLTSGMLGGNVSGGVLGARTNYIALRFSDGSAMPIIDEGAAGAAFQYLVPDIAGASFVVGAADGTSAFPPYAVAHRENIAFGASDVALAIPRPVTLQSPQNGDPNVTPSTPYGWSAVSQTAQTFLWHLEFDNTFEGMFVLTSSTQIELPTFADGFTVPQSVAVTWSVETHGDAPSVDAVAGPDGYLDAFSLGETYPIGPNGADGYYTESERRGFVMGAD